MRGHNQRPFICAILFLLCIQIDDVSGFSLPGPPGTLLTTSNASRNVGLCMAKKKGPKNKKKASTSKGFGAPPPTLEEVISEFRTRLPKSDASDEMCACGSGKKYSDCCSFYHQNLNENLPETYTAIGLLRSRYTAFAWRLPFYVIESTHPQCGDFISDKIKWAKDLNRSGMFDSYDFVGLEDIGDIEKGADESEAFVAFSVRMRARENTGPHLEGQEIVIKEKSRFLRDGQPVRWRYASGDVTFEDIKING